MAPIAKTPTESSSAPLNGAKENGSRSEYISVLLYFRMFFSFLHSVLTRVNVVLAKQVWTYLHFDDVTARDSFNSLFWQSAAKGGKLSLIEL